MTRAFAALQDERRDFELRPWLFRIAHNEAISILRRRRATAELDDVPERLGELEDRVAEREELRLLQLDLADLPERQRAALVLRELNGLSHAEIGVVLELSTAAVKQSIFEARTALFSCREGREMACHDVRRMLSDGDGRVLRGRGVRAHLRTCADCRRFRADLEQRPRALRALAPPLPVGGRGRAARRSCSAAGRRRSCWPASRSPAAGRRSRSRCNARAPAARRRRGRRPRRRRGRSAEPPKRGRRRVPIAASPRRRAEPPRRAPGHDEARRSRDGRGEAAPSAREPGASRAKPAKPAKPVKLAKPPRPRRSSSRQAREEARRRQAQGHASVKPARPPKPPKAVKPREARRSPERPRATSSAAGLAQRLPLRRCLPQWRAQCG